MNLPTLGMLAAGLSLCACATAGEIRPDRGPVDGVVRLEGKSGEALSGTATFRRLGSRVELIVRVANAPPGVHGIHLHQVGDCSAPDATSAGDHWNPTGAAHGVINGSPAHLGDIGNLVVDPDGRGLLQFIAEEWSIGTGEPNDVLGRALVIHADLDDFVSQPAGNAGARIGCGVVQRSGGMPVSLR